MKVHVDRQADALYIRLNENAIVESEEVQPGVVLDFDGEGLVVGIEVLGISQQASPVELRGLEGSASLIRRGRGWRGPTRGR